MPSKKPESGAAQQEVSRELLEDFMHTSASSLLKDPNITSVGIGRKITNGKRTADLSIQVTVQKKLPGPQLEAAGTTLVPKSVVFKGVKIPTDVIERSFKPSYTVVVPQQKTNRKRRLDPMAPGISVSHPKGTAGTLGTFVYDTRTGAPCILSNWHVLNTPDGMIGDFVVQPGPYDDNQVDNNKAGVLLRSHLGLAGDCAIARIDGRGFDPHILDLNVAVGELAKVALDDRVIKSGRTTNVTHGIVRRTDVITKLDYGSAGEQQISGFEIGPDEEFPAADNQISDGGDSGSVWLIAGNDGKPTNLMAGLHFAGEGTGDPDDHAVACYAQSVFEKLEITLEPPAASQVLQAVTASGYNDTFTGAGVPVPDVLNENDVYSFHGAPTIPYTHFSVCLSKSRKMCRYVAWNIDGNQLKTYGRVGLQFVLDPRVDAQYQIGNEAYSNNKLDRGHIARRADLVWGPKVEAQKANKDSFFYTNITPQHEKFNQSQRAGLWGLLENAVYEDTEVDGLKLSVMGGPIFKPKDMDYRGIKIPGSYWKALFFKENGQLRAKAYILTQDDLLNDIEALELDEFRLYQVNLTVVEERAQIQFTAAVKAADTAAGPEAVETRTTRRQPLVREVVNREDLIR